VIHNLVLETTRLGIDVKNLKMRVESMSSRLDFDERRARALEGVVQYRPGTAAPLQPPTGGGDSRESRGSESPEQSERRNRRRRRRGRRRPDERSGVTGEGLPRASEGGRESRGAMGASSGASNSAPTSEQSGDFERQDRAPAAEPDRSGSDTYESSDDGDRSES